jgi:three-Cys-motif partner protein
MASVLDPDDGLIVDEVGPWATEKHDRLKRYIDASRGARMRFLPPKGAGAAYIELFCGSGRSLIRDTSHLIDGSPVVAYKAAQASNAPFSELHLNDIDPAKVAAAKMRIEEIGGAVVDHSGIADVIVDRIVHAISPYGLHFTFIDPYNLEQLPFSIIEKLASVQRMDMLIHVSVQDLQRNLDDYSLPGGVFDSFIPGWREKVNQNQAINPLRASLLECWLNKIRSLGTTPAQGIELVAGPRGQRLYWLVFCEPA